MRLFKYSAYALLGIICFVAAYNFLGFWNKLESHDGLTLVLLGYILIVTVLHYERAFKEAKYACFFSKKIIDSESQEVLAELHQDFYLPMRPFVGLSISAPWTDTILSISCDTECQTFYCTTKPREVKKTDNLGQILAGYYEHTSWHLWNLYEEAEKLLERYIEEEEKRLAESGQTRCDLEKIKRKREAVLIERENNA